MKLLCIPAIALAAFTTAAFSQDAVNYPNRPIRMIVPFAPGGGLDISTRLIAQKLTEKWGQNIVVDSRPGAATIVGTEIASKSEPDGYTFLLATNAYSVNPALYNKLPYDALKDFVGVSELVTTPNTFVVKSELPAKTLKEFVALVRANPDKFNVSTPPIGTTPQIAAEMFKLREKLPMLQSVVFKGGGDALQAVLSGTTQLSVGSLPPAAAHIKAGTLRCLAVTGEARWPDLPNVPTMAEAGYKDFVLAVDCVLLAPAKTPPEAIKWLETETLKVLGTPEMKEKLSKAGFQVRPKGAKDAWARVTKEMEMFKGVIEQAGMKKL